MGNEQSLPGNPQNPHSNRARSLSPLPRDPDALNGESDDQTRFPATQPVPKKSRFLDPPDPDPEPAPEPDSPVRKPKKNREHRRGRRSGSFSAMQPAEVERRSPSLDARPSTQPEFSEVKKKSKKDKTKKKSKRHSLLSQVAEEETAILDPAPEPPSATPHFALFAARGFPQRAVLEEQEQEGSEFLDNLTVESATLGKKKRRGSKGSETAEDMSGTTLRNHQDQHPQLSQWPGELEEYRSDDNAHALTKAPPPDEEDETQLNSSRREVVDYEMEDEFPSGFPSSITPYTGPNGYGQEPGSPTVSESSLPELPKDDDHVVKYRDNYPEHSGDEDDQEGETRAGSPSLSQPKGREMSRALDDDDDMAVNGNLKAAPPSPSPPPSPELHQQPDPAPPTSSARAPGSQSSRKLKKKLPFFERENEQPAIASSDAAAEEAEAPPSHQPDPSQPRSSQLKKAKKSRSEPRPETIPESDLEDTPVASKTPVTYGRKSSQKSSQASSRKPRRLPTPEAAPESDLDQAEAVPEPVPATNSRSSQKSPKKNRPQPQPEDAPESDIEEADASPEAPVASSKKPTKKPAQKSSRKSSQKLSKPKKSAPVVERSQEYVEDESADEPQEEEEEVAPVTEFKTGVMTESEAKKIKRAVQRFREAEGMSQEEVNKIIHENPQSKAGPKEAHQRLWTLVVEGCPTRPRKKLILWCRKNFHNFVARGKWTTEQDDELAELVKSHGNAWVKIGSIVNRHPDDVRDRWRNYVVCRDTANTDQWSVEEEEKLKEVYQNALQKIQDKLDEEGNTGLNAEDLVSWQVVSDDMGRTRSRLQCQEKWKRLKDAEPLADRDQVVTLLPAGNNGWRIKKARKDLKRIGAVQKNTLVCAIKAGGYEHERDVGWKDIVENVFEKKYERQALVVVWGRLKQSVPDFSEKTVHECAKYLARMYKKEGNFGTQLEFDDGQSSEDEASVRSNSVRKNTKPKPKSRFAVEPKKVKTPAEAISDDDEEEEAEQMDVDQENDDHEVEDATQTTPEIADVSQMSPTFNGVPVSNSPSVIAEASRARRRERSASVAASVAAAAATASAAPTPHRSKSKSRERRKSRERQERDQESAAAAATVIPQSPDRPAASQEPPDSVKRSSRKRRLSSSGANGELWSGASLKKREKAVRKKRRFSGRDDEAGLSSDMDDMEDIPARTQLSQRSSQV
ncbi:hypothetical protein QBC44DRAFT_337331 [Cladorrhinum sp. PSN332]|nr:hypothetical protein QBC44DRAFT_337331 [Cladorrhinum sp. PSN332]